MAAARLHESSAAIVRLDIDRFFDHVTRTKIARALRAIGFPADEAFEAARLSTVRKPGHAGYSAPFGFVQSPLLASLVLDRSALGRSLRRIKSAGALLSVYVDDILLSSDSAATTQAFLAEVQVAANASGLPLNLAKSQLQPGPAAEAFNLHIGNGMLRVNGLRMTKFSSDAYYASAEQLEGYAYYLNSVNHNQAIKFLDDLEQAGLRLP